MGRAAAGAALETVSKDAAKAAAEAAAKDAAELAAKDAAKAAAEAAAKDAAKTAAKDAAEAAAKDASKISAKDAAKYTAAAAAAGVGVYLYASSSQDAEESNKTPRGITKLESVDGKSKKVLNVYFTPAIRILKSDIITISGSKTTPSIDGPQTVKNVVSDGQIVIDFGKDIKTMTEGGTINVKTSTGDHIQSKINEAASDLGETVGGATGGFARSLFGDLADSLGIDPTWIAWGSAGLMCCLCMICMIVIIMNFS